MTMASVQATPPPRRAICSTVSFLLLSSPLPLFAFTLSHHPNNNHHNPTLSKSSTRSTPLFSSTQRRPPSTVTDPDGPTPPKTPSPIPEIDITTLPEYSYDPNNHPIPHQPWRRGDTDGCHDPITAPWRLEAESIISDAVNIVGGKVVDVTWYMAKCVISLDMASLNNVVSYVEGPEVKIMYPDSTDISGHIFHDPTSGTEEELWTEEDEVLDYEQYDEDTEYEILKANMPEEYDEETGEKLPPREPKGRVERMLDLEEERMDQLLNAEEGVEERPADGLFAHPVDTKALSVCSKAIMDALGEERVEERLAILSRHDIILTSPLDSPVILDSQKEFDNARDLDVYVETRDPWGSNRILGGKLVDRNAMDVIINQDNSGRMVTIPNSMIHQVLLVSGLKVGSERLKKEVMEDEDGEENGEEDGDDIEEEELYMDDEDEDD